MIVNFILLFCGTFALYYGLDFYIQARKTEIGKLSFYVLILGIGCALWNFGYAFMGFTTELDKAPLYRQLALTGIVIFMSFEGFLFIYKAGLSKSVFYIFSVIFFILAVGDVTIWGAHDVRSYYRIGDRTLYTSGTSNGYFYQPVYMVVMGITLFVLWSIWRKRTVFERDIRFQKMLFCTNVFIVLGSILDTILPIFGFESFPGSPFGSTLTYLAMLSVLNKYGKYSISKNNLSKFIYEHEHTGFLTFNLHGRLVACNTFAKENLGIDKIKNQRISDLFVLKDETDKEMVAKILEVGDGEWRLKTKKTYAVCSLNFSEALDEFGDPYCIICAIYDRSAEEELLESIRRSGEAKSSFLASMTHEIRTPINAVLGMCEMIQRESTNEEILGYAHNMDQAGGQLLSIVNDVLDYSKIQSNMMDLIPVDYDLRDMIHNLVINYSQAAGAKNIDFKYYVDETLPAYLNGDEVRIQQIIKNLLDNALKYTEIGCVGLEFSNKKLSEDEIELKIIVSDSGKGISKEDQPKLFDAFIRADHNKNQTIAGTGVGLAIVGNLVRMMKGTISIDSDLGEGSIFSITIPQRVVSYHQIGNYEKSLEEYRAEHVTGWNGNFTAPAARILIVDDNSVNLSVAKFLLERTEAKVDTATSGLEAIEMLANESYQLVFLDHIMPGMDGIETIHKIRDEHLAEDIPIIALTANDVAGAKEMYLDYGFQDFLAKPVSKGSLEKKVCDWLPKSYIHTIDDESNEDKDNAEVKLGHLPEKYEGCMDGNEYVYVDDDYSNQLTHIFIINPIASSTSFVSEIREFLSRTTDLRYFIFSTNSPGSETDMVHKIQQYFAKERLRIYSIGGSGTLRNILNGIEDFERIEVACCPTGLTNDFMKVFGYDQEKFKDIKSLIRGDVKKVDYIKTTGGVCINTFSLGLDANIVIMLEKGRIFSVFGKMFPYIIAFIYSMFISTPDEYEIFVDGRKVYEGSSSQIIFGNGNVLGGTFKFGPPQNITDGKGCVMIGGSYLGFGMMPSVMALVKGNINKLNKTNILSEGNRFSIRRRDGGQLAMNFDGEMVYGIEQWDAEIVNKGLNFVVPKGVTWNE